MITVKSSSHFQTGNDFKDSGNIGMENKEHSGPQVNEIVAALQATRKGKLYYDPNWSPESGHISGLSSPKALQLSPFLLRQQKTSPKESITPLSASPVLDGGCNDDILNDFGSISNRFYNPRQTCITSGNEGKDLSHQARELERQNSSIALMSSKTDSALLGAVLEYSITASLRQVLERDVKNLRQDGSSCFSDQIVSRKLNFANEVSQIQMDKRIDFVSIDEDRSMEIAKDLLATEDLSLQYQEQEQIEAEKRRQAYELKHQTSQKQLETILSRKKKLKEIHEEEQRQFEETRRKEEALEKKRKEEEHRKLLELKRQLEGIGEQAKKHVTFISDNFKSSKFKDHLPPQSHQISELAHNEFIKCISIVSEGVSGKDAASKIEEARRSVLQMEKLVNDANAALQIAEKNSKEAMVKAASQVANTVSSSVASTTAKSHPPTTTVTDQVEKGTKVATLQDEIAILDKEACVGVCFSASSVDNYKRLRTLLEAHRKKCNGIVSTVDKARKRIRFDMKRAINTPLNAVSDQTPRHLLDKIRRISIVLSGKELEVSGKRVNPLADPEGLDYCKGLFSEELVLQGAKQVSSNHSSAFSFAAVALGVWVQLPDVGELILATFYEKCPYLVPLSPTRIPSESSASYFKRLGYEVDDDVIESSEKYLKKLSGIVRLYAALIQSPVPQQFARFAHPHGLSHGWSWFARILNLPPLPTITATVLFDFLEVAGHALLRVYGQQFKKLMFILCNNFIREIEGVTPKNERGPVIRLKGFLDKVLQTGKIPEPAGYIAGAWWTS